MQNASLLLCSLSHKLPGGPEVCVATSESACCVSEPWGSASPCECCCWSSSPSPPPTFTAAASHLSPPGHCRPGPATCRFRPQSGRQLLVALSVMMKLVSRRSAPNQAALLTIPWTRLRFSGNVLPLPAGDGFTVP